MNIPVICRETPEREGLYINTYYYPLGAYELWVPGPEGKLFKHGWIAVSEIEKDPDTFLERWLDKVGFPWK